MKELNVAVKSGTYYFKFTLDSVEADKIITLNLQEIVTLDAAINQINKLGLLTENPVTNNVIFTINIDQLFKKIDQLFPEKKTDVNLKGEVGHYV